jgi:hypothetical protein
MTEPEVALLKSTLAKSKQYLEYGAGGSTKLAVGVPGISCIASVESDPAFVGKTLANEAEISAAVKSGRLRFLLADIGPTGDWGHPVNTSKDFLWPNYALCPFLHGFTPDLILVDGRFRVACGLAAILQAPAATVLIHDYTLRPNLHILERFLSIEESADTLVMCRRKKQINENAVKRLLKIYLYNSADLRPLRRRLSQLKRSILGNSRNNVTN